MSQLGDRPLDETDLNPDPLALLRVWFADAEAHDVSEPNAAALATATPDGRPSLRMVLTKGVDERGIVFFTNYGSRKAGELEGNPRAAMMVHWSALGRQVLVEGHVGRVEGSETLA